MPGQTCPVASLLVVPGVGGLVQPDTSNSYAPISGVAGSRDTPNISVVTPTAVPLSLRAVENGL